MSIKDVMAYLKSLEVVPSVPSEKNMTAQKKPLSINAVPPVPSVPCKFTDTRLKNAAETPETSETSWGFSKKPL